MRRSSMPRATAIWLTTCLLLLPAPTRAAEESPVAPPVPPWPTGLSQPRRTPDGILLLPDLATAVHGRLLYLDRYPEVCQAVLDGRGAVLTTQCAEQRKLDAAQAAAASDKRSASAEAHRLTLGKVLGIGVASAALGALAVLIAEHH